MKKRLVAFVLALFLVLTLLPSDAFAAATSVTVAVSVSADGSFVTDKSGTEMFNRDITLTGQESYTIEDALTKAHALYAKNGASDLEITDSAYGASLTKVWGISRGYQYTYDLNDGSKDVNTDMLSTKLAAGDYLHVAVMQNAYPDTEDYAFFAERTASAAAGKSVTVTLKGLTWVGMAQSEYNVSGATIYVDGKATSTKTDANGQATLSGLSVGTHRVKAVKTKTVDGKTVTAITANAEDITVTAPAKGTTLKTSSASYKVTKAGKEVSYVKPAKKKATVSIPKTVKANGVTYKVTSIAAKAFKNDSTVKTLTISANVKTIGKQAFYNAKNLRKVTIKTKSLTTGRVGAKAFAKAGKANYKKLVVKVPAAKKKAYKKIFKKKGLSSKAKIK